MQSEYPFGPHSGYLSGRMLIAAPNMGDPRFARSLIYVCGHSDEQTMGLVINHPLEGLRLPDLLEQLDIKSDIQVPDQPVLYGGPVERERGFVLHSLDYRTEDATMPISDQIGLTASKDILLAINSDHPPRHSALALGFANWGAGQIEDEMAQNAWLVCDADEDLIFDNAYGSKWDRAMAKIGVDPSRLVDGTGLA
ncbi:MAG: YqgE/AlgH family protein [Robiginitomaculum sp.]|nr:YqgE/AlgH family protein [Robiginitomaculum sp.]MDQ7078146.1 YqgE/AlgH family protein [Robiginitomaculum sp.]